MVSDRDLFSLASIRRLPETLRVMEIPPIRGLILNAGGINMKAKSLEFTEDGFRSEPIFPGFDSPLARNPACYGDSADQGLDPECRRHQHESQIAGVYRGWF